MDMQHKIRSLFQQAASTHSEYEAHEAILKAHALMAKYNIVLDDEADPEEIVSEYLDTPGNCSFRKILAPIIGTNFRVRGFFMSNGGMTYFGHKTDVLVAKDVFEYAYQFANKKSRRIVDDLRRRHMNTDGVKQSYVYGFCQGLRERLDAQSVALAVVIPQDVEEQYKEIVSGLKPKKSRRQRLSIHVKQYSPSYHDMGLKDGREVLDRHDKERKAG